MSKPSEESDEQEDSLFIRTDVAGEEDEYGDEGLDLENDDLDDYKAVPSLDKYDESMLDQSEVRPLSSSARRAAEAEMSARDERKKLGIWQESSASGVGGRGPKAMAQVQANLDGNKEVAWLAKRVKAAPAIVNKASELIRKTYTGVRCLSPGERLCLPAACLEIGARLLKRPLQRDTLLEQAGLRKKDYMRVYAAVHCMLNIKREISVAELCQEFKCNGIKASTRQLLETFKSQFWAALPAERRQHADFSRPVFAVCALYITAERNKAVVKVPCKKELMKATDVSQTDFDRVFSQMDALCTRAVMMGATPNSSERLNLEAEYRVVPSSSSGSHIPQKPSASESTTQDTTTLKNAPPTVADKHQDLAEGAEGPQAATCASSSAAEQQAAADICQSDTHIQVDTLATAESKIPSTPAPVAKVSDESAKSQEHTAKKREPIGPVTARKLVTAAQRLNNFARFSSSPGGLKKPTVEQPPAHSSTCPSPLPTCSVGVKRPADTALSTSSENIADAGVRSIVVCADGKAKACPSATTMKKRKLEQKAEEMRKKSLEFEEFKQEYLKKREEEKENARKAAEEESERERQAAENENENENVNQGGEGDVETDTGIRDSTHTVSSHAVNGETGAANVMGGSDSAPHGDGDDVTRVDTIDLCAPSKTRSVETVEDKGDKNQSKATQKQGNRGKIVSKSDDGSKNKKESLEKSQEGQGKKGNGGGDKKREGSETEREGCNKDKKQRMIFDFIKPKNATAPAPTSDVADAHHGCASNAEARSDSGGQVEDSSSKTNTGTSAGVDLCDLEATCETSNLDPAILRERRAAAAEARMRDAEREDAQL